MKIKLRPQNNEILDTETLRKLCLDPNIPSLNIELEPGEYQWGGEPIWCNKPLFISGQRDLSARVFLGDGFYIGIGKYISPFYSPGFATAPIDQGRSELKADWAKPGDWVMLWSHDDIPGCRPHTGFRHSRPGELHRVSREKSGMLILGQPTWNPMLKNTQGAVINMISGCGAANIHFSRQDPKPNSFHRIFDLIGCLSPRFERIWTGYEGAGDIFVRYCADVKIDDFSGIRQTSDSNRVYAVVTGPVNGLRFSNSTWGEVRHIFTTSGIDGGNGTHYGTILNCVIDNILATSGGNDRNEGMVLFDTHPQGGDILFKNCEAKTGSDRNSMIGFQSRSPGTRFENCRTVGMKGGATYGIRLLADNCEVDRFRAEDCWFGARLEKFNNSSITNSTFVRCHGAPIDVKSGKNHFIDGSSNVYKDCKENRISRAASLRAQF